MNWSDLKKHWAECDKKERSQRESWAHENMLKINDLMLAIKQDGWRDIIYCPKDGTEFLAWSPEYKTPFICKYMGNWPNGSWWAFCSGDMWPALPILFKEIK